jgi:tetratricopeptide (TPR) repeat protein
MSVLTPLATASNGWPAERRRGPRRAIAAVLLLSVSLLGSCAGSPSESPGVVDRSGTVLSTSAAIDADGPSAAGDYLAGRFALDQGDLRTAATSFERALAADPDNLELRRQIFLLKVAGGDIDGALAGADELSAIDPEADEVELLFALREVKRGDYAAARERLALISPRGVTGLSAPLLDAWMLYGAGDVAAALRRMRGGEADDGLGQLRRYHESMMLALSGQTADAARLMRGEVAEEAPAPLRFVQAMAALDAAAGNRDAALRLLRRQVAMGDDDGTLAEMLRAAEAGRMPMLPVTGAPAGMSDALLGVAEALSQQRAGAQGLLFARLAAYLEPERGDVWMLIGRIEQAQGNAAEAIRAYESVPGDSPFAWEAHLARAEALSAADRSDEAAAALRELAEQRPERTDALRELGDLYRRQESFPEAEAAYGEAIARLPQVQAEDWRLFYARGIALERMGRWPDAEASLSRALELAPDQPLVLNYLGYSWVDQGENLDRAKQMLHRAVELRPQDGFIVDSLGWAYFRMAEFDNAVAQLERAVELEPGDPVINDHLGDAYWRVGREREARFQWQRALTLKPEEKDVAQIETKLQHGLPAATSARRG